MTIALFFRDRIEKREDDVAAGEEPGEFVGLAVDDGNVLETAVVHEGGDFGEVVVFVGELDFFGGAVHDVDGLELFDDVFVALVVVVGFEDGGVEDLRNAVLLAGAAGDETDDVAVREEAHEMAGGIDDGQAADAVVAEEVDGVLHGGVVGDGDGIFDHDVFDFFHCWLSFQNQSLMERLLNQSL